MTHFSDKTKKADRVINDMKVILHRYKGDSTEQRQRLEVLDELVNYCIKLEVELNDTQEQLGTTMMYVGKLKSELREMERKYYISEQVNETSIEETYSKYIEYVQIQNNIKVGQD